MSITTTASNQAAEPQELKKFYLTFGCGMKYAKHYCVIEAPSYEEARARVFEIFGPKWCWLYSAQEWLKRGIPQHEIYGYKLLNLEDVTRE